PAKIVKLASEYEVAVGQSVSLRCQAEGNPKPTYTWTPCESVCHESTLNIPGVLSDGVYTCKVANGLGSDRRFTSLDEQGLLLVKVATTVQDWSMF
ncbi:Vascular cell adhesion, partial [Desmophyllum pertusum]